VHSVPPLSKITVPRAHEPVLRPRLFQRLDQLRTSPILWLAGPPGAGKTTLASSYVSQHKGHHLWYQFDAGDADPATFFHYFRLALQQATPHKLLELPALTPEFLPGLATFVRRYAEVMASSLKKPTICVLDNFEHVPDDSVLPAVIRELASSLPPEIGFIVLSRSEPPPVFARLRLYGQLVVLGGHELNLTEDEAREVVAAREARTGVRWESERIERLLIETQGWIAGFTLQLEDFRNADRSFRALSEVPQLVFDYFATEFFGHFPASVQRGLLYAALLPVMTTLNVERLTGDPQINTVLADLQRRNCFVVQHGQAEPAYEYHGLFRAFLLNRAVAEVPSDQWRGLQRKGADLLAEAKHIDAAATLYQGVEYWPGLSALALREGQALISQGRHQTLNRWLNCLPDGFYIETPWLCYWRGMACLPFDPVEARAHFEQAYGGFRTKDDVEGLYSAWAGIMESFFYEWQDLRPADPWIAEFDALRNRHPNFPSRVLELRTYWAMGTLLHRQPQHPFVPIWAERAEAILSVSNCELSVLLGGYLVIHHLWRGDCAKAQDLIRRLAPWAQTPEFPPLVSILWSCAVGLYHSVRGELEECLAVVGAGMSQAGQAGLNCWDFLLSAQAARCSLIAGSLADADIWIARMSTTMRTHSHINGGFIEHLRSNASTQRRDWPKALEHGRKGLAMALEAGVPFLEAHCRIDLARALTAQGDPAEWQEHLQIAHGIGQGMDSGVLQHLCLEAKASAALAQGEQSEGRDWLTHALAVSREMGEPVWQMAGPRFITPLYEHALALGIETDHVRQVIRRRRLIPSDPATAPDLWPWSLRVNTLGRFEILRDDEPIRSSRQGPTQAFGVAEGFVCLWRSGHPSRSRYRGAMARCRR
jgi:LuxR family maltose regulon positive regulatory protein